MMDSVKTRELQPSLLYACTHSSFIRTFHPQSVPHVLPSSLHYDSPFVSPQKRNLDNSASSEAEATPTSSQLSSYSQSQTNSDGFGYSSLDDSEELSDPLASEGVDSSKTDRLKVFDFEDENSHDSDASPVTKPTKPPSRNQMGQKPVRRVRVGRVGRTSSALAKRSKDTQMTLTSFSLFADRTKLPEKSISSSQEIKGLVKAVSQACAGIKGQIPVGGKGQAEADGPLKNTRNVVGSNTVKNREASTVPLSKNSAPRNVAETREVQGSVKALSKNSPLLSSVTTPVADEGGVAKSSAASNIRSTASRNVASPRKMEVAVSKGTLSSKSGVAQKGGVALKGGAVSRTPFASKGGPPSDKGGPQLSSEGDNTLTGRNKTSTVPLSSSSSSPSPSTLPDFPVAEVPKHRENWSNQTTKNHTSKREKPSLAVPLEPHASPHTGPLDQLGPDVPEDPYSFASSFAEKPRPASSGSRLAKQCVQDPCDTSSLTERPNSSNAGSRMAKHSVQDPYAFQDADSPPPGKPISSNTGSMVAKHRVQDPYSFHSTASRSSGKPNSNSTNTGSRTANRRVRVQESYSLHNTVPPITANFSSADTGSKSETHCPQPSNQNDPFSFDESDSPSGSEFSKLTKKRVPPTSSSKAAKSQVGSKELSKEIGSGSLKGESGKGGPSKGATKVKLDYSRKRAEGTVLTLSPAKNRTRPGCTLLKSADLAASDDMLHEIDALLEDGNDGGRGLWGGSSKSSSTGTKEPVSAGYDQATSSWWPL